MTAITQIQHKLEKKLKPERYEHTVGVMFTAASLAMCYGANVNSAMIAGLLHDCGKYCSGKEQIELCREWGIVLTQSELDMPPLIHAKLGAYLAEKEYNIMDPDILSAITFHTTGRPNMSLLEKIIYIADYIEPGRREIPTLEKIQRVSFADIDKAIELCTESTISYLKKMGRGIDPLTIRTYEHYHKKSN